MRLTPSSSEAAAAARDAPAAGHPKADGGGHRTAWMWLLAAVLLGAALRLYRLTDWSLWIDEALTISDALHTEHWSIHRRPINYLLTRLALDTFGVSELSARLVPFLFGIATIPLTYAFVRTVLGPRQGILAAFFLALSPWHIYWSQSARHFAFVVFVVLALMWVFYLAFEMNSRILLALSVLLLPVAYLGHPMTVLIFPALVAYLGISKLSFPDLPRGYSWKNILLFGIPPAIVGFLLAPHWLSRFRFYEDLRGMRGGAGDPLYSLMTLVHHVQVPLLALAAIGVVLLAVQRSRGGIFLASAAAFPVLMLLVIASQTPANPLYVLYALPALCGLAAEPFCALAAAVEKRERLLAWGMATVVLGTQLAHGYLYFFHQFGDRPRWREATMLVRELKDSGDRVVSTGAPVIEYYMANGNTNLRESISTESLNFKTLNLDGTEGGRIWYVLDRPSLEGHDPEGKVERWLFKHARLVQEFRALTSVRDRSVRVFLYESRRSEHNPVPVVAHDRPVWEFDGR